MFFGFILKIIPVFALECKQWVLIKVYLNAILTCLALLLPAGTDNNNILKEITNRRQIFFIWII
jgi:hypothetical protein